MIFRAGYGMIYNMRDNLGRFVKGSNYWLGKKRPGFKNKTSFKKGAIPWNKGLTKNDPRVAKYVNANLDRVNKICELCNNKFDVNRFREKTGRFCSRKCRSDFFGRIRTNKNSANFAKRNGNKEKWNEYVYLHKWVEKELGRPLICEMCGVGDKKRYHWANISGEYKKEVSDWIRLCPSCHENYDNQKRRLRSSV